MTYINARTFMMVAVINKVMKRKMICITEQTNTTPTVIKTGYKNGMTFIIDMMYMTATEKNWTLQIQ